MSSPEESIKQILTERGLTISAAESCTGGRVSDRITDVSGSSEYFLGGVVAYSNETKISILGVDRKSLSDHGAVSREVAAEMAAGCRRAFDSDIAVSTTGIAGPTGGTESKPVGLVWFSIADDDRTATEQKIFNGDRDSIKEQASGHALALVLRFLDEK